MTAASSTPDAEPRTPRRHRRKPTPPRRDAPPQPQDASTPTQGWTVVDMLGGAATLQRKVDTALDAHELLVEGLPAGALQQLVDRVGLLRDGRNFTTALGMSLRTQQRKNGGTALRLNREQSGRTWKFAEILARASEVLGSQRSAEDWLVRQAPALDRRTPLELLGTAAGARLVEDLLTRMDYGVYT